MRQNHGLQDLDRRAVCKPSCTIVSSFSALIERFCSALLVVQHLLVLQQQQLQPALACNLDL
eukprot:1889604-Rhodomonas_salina.1